MERRKLIIDTDCGSDDAMAIAIALKDPAYEIAMFTTLVGNVSARQATANLLTVLKLTDAYYPPVYIGEERPLKREFIGSADTHGEDGMGDLGLVDYSLEHDEGHGVDMIIETLEDSKQGEIDIVAIGPLTNLGKVAMRRPDLLRKAGRILCMASQGFGEGNMSEFAEFNIFQDPEACQVLLDLRLDNLYFVSWEACLGECILDQDDIDELSNLSELSNFMIRCNRQLLELNRQRFEEDCLDMADPAAMIAYLHPECIEESRKYYCNVMLKDDDPHYGELLIEDDIERANVYLISRLNGELYKKILKEKLA